MLASPSDARNAVVAMLSRCPTRYMGHATRPDTANSPPAGVHLSRLFGKLRHQIPQGMGVWKADPPRAADRLPLPREGQRLVAV
ncbi:uncharacterized protein SETTUDRAFT_152514 [Exserohilum turcica Et28A]|uniref:Uncharacterized protein n=1 Tax=Exserohilum turcicum (strain 28A) TaxID=671987 RepID=R0KQV7_EXST2|nr:uncharacterized protein SETTUDRAFT_152514 [Exserohilum turcica Et28A]EOA91399.1 hypothetical protein SETTUDRAFT_152514 [Exserohilum turcica Et28A]